MSKVVVRKKPLTKNRKSLYLDYSPPIFNSSINKLQRFEYLKLFIYNEPANKFERIHNKETNQLVEWLRLKRQLDVQNKRFGFLSESSRGGSFINFFKKYTGKRQKGDSDNMDMAFRYFERFVSKGLKFCDLNESICEGFRSYLVNSIKQFGTPYHYFVHPTVAASVQAAAVQAAHDVLVNYFPNQKKALDQALDNSLKTITDGPVTAGLAVGAAAAADIIAFRANDGANPGITYTGTAKPGIGQYRPTPAGFVPGIDQQWGNIKPFLLISSNQFRPVPPPEVGSADYKRGLALVADIGAENSKTRTADQTHIAQFYKQDAELTVNEAARELAIDHGTSLEENALIFVLTDIAEADARISVWDSKYTYLYWRPVTALNADVDGGVTNDYAAWKPLIPTPPHPSYACGHCGTVTSGFEVLKTFFGDYNNITLHTTTAGEPPRVIYSLSSGEVENALSRVYGGVHYPFDDAASEQIGQRVAQYVLANGPKFNK